MALINCTECGTEVSTAAVACPKCGAPPKKSGLSKTATWLIVGVCAIGAIGYLSDRQPNIPGASPSSRVGETKSSGTSKVEDLIAKGEIYNPGTYAQGRIAPGEYAFVSERGGYFSEEKNGQILDNANFPSFGYVYVHGVGDVTTRGILFSKKALAELGYSGAKSVYEALTKTSGHRFSGTYLVGSDLPPGRYVLESTGSAYVAVNTGPVGKAKILQNDNFNGSKTVSVASGQYLEVSRATISPSAN